MEKILARLTNKKVKAPTTIADPTLIEADLSSWEIINRSSFSFSSSSDDDEIETYSFNDEEEDDEQEDIFVLDSVPPDVVRIDAGDAEVVSIDKATVIDDYDIGDYSYDVMEDQEEEDNYDEDDDDDDDDYDDELVPRSLSDRFGKQRLMKLGKRACNPKMSNPKKLPCYFYNRPGGVPAANKVVAWKRKIVRNKQA
jgi:hypothetical protein